jgi:hypothetical protein
LVASLCKRVRRHDALIAQTYNGDVDPASALVIQAR